MPEMSLKDTIVTSLTAQEPWPENVKLFQPYEVEQILLPDNASCLAVQAFLKMCNLPFEVEMRWNAEFMSPSGRVPFIKCGAFVVSELEPIVQFAANKGVSLCSKLTSEEKAEMRAYMSLITNVLVNAELYISWLDEATFTGVTKARNSSVYPWPLSWIQTRSKRAAVAKRLKALHWHDKTLEQVRADVEQCCNSLSQRLGDKDFFFGTPTPLDALTSGHTRALLSHTGPRAALLVRPITGPLLRHALRVARITGMRLTSQEEYLVSQVYHFYRSPTRASSEKSSHSRRSRLSFKYENCDTYGFKPFASKELLNDDFGSQNRKLKDKQCLSYIDGVMEEILDKVDEMAFKCDKCYYGEKGNFESPDNFGDVTDFLDTIDENDLSNDTNDTSLNDMDMSLLMDSDGLVNDKLLEVNEEAPPEDFGDSMPKGIPIMRGSGIGTYRNSRRTPSLPSSPSPRSPLRSPSPNLTSNFYRNRHSPSFSPNSRMSLTPNGSPERNHSPPPGKRLSRLSPPLAVRRFSPPLNQDRSLSPKARQGIPVFSVDRKSPPLSPKRANFPARMSQTKIQGEEKLVQPRVQAGEKHLVSPPKSISPSGKESALSLQTPGIFSSSSPQRKSSSTSSPDLFFSESRATMKAPSEDSVTIPEVLQPVLKAEIIAETEI